jgi:hypothetical protein
VLEDVSMEDAAVDKWDGDFLLVFAAVLVDEMPPQTGDVFVDARNGAFPMFLLVNRSLDALAALEPVSRAEHSAETDEEIWCHIRYEKMTKEEMMDRAKREEE